MRIVVFLLLIQACFIPSTKVYAQNGAGHKIVVMDTGLIPEQTIFIDRIVDQYCYSQADVRNLEGNAQIDHYDIGSLCKQGVATDFSSVDAAVVPRLVAHRPPRSIDTSLYLNHSFGSDHGTLVYNEAVSAASGAEFIMVAGHHYDSRASTNDGITCGIHGPGGNFDIRGRMDATPCYPASGGLVDNTFIDTILADHENIAAINFSAGGLRNQFIQEITCSRGSIVFSRLKSENIAVVAAAGNDGQFVPVSWPGCNDKVIAVGSVDGDTGDVSEFTSTGSDHIEFLANGLSFSGGGNRGTSFAAPRVAGAFAVVQSAESRVRTIDEIKFALNEAATDFRVIGNRSIPIITRQTALDAASCLISGECEMPQQAPGSEELNFEDGGSYGNVLFGESAEDVEIIIEQNPIELATPPLPNQNQIVLESQSLIVSDTTENTVLATHPISNNISSLTQSSVISRQTESGTPRVRDVVLSFDGEFNVSNTFDVFVNEELAASERFTGTRRVEFTLNRGYFSEGFNTIRIHPRSVLGNRLWGVSNIRAEYRPIVPLVVNVVDQNRYGADQSPERPTGLRMSFELDGSESAITLSATGADVFPSDEIEVYVNGRFQGILDNGSSLLSQSEPNLFSLPSDDLLEGTNILEFVQKENGINDWLVTDIGVFANNARPTLTIGVTDSTRYGNGFGTNENALELEVDFIPMGNHDHVLSWQAFDIETTSDVEVLLNDFPIKAFERTINNRVGSSETITLAARLFQNGANTLKFQRSPIVDDTWGVTSLNLRPSTVLDLDNETSFDATHGYYELINNRPSGWTRVYSEEGYQTRLYATFENTSNLDRSLSLQGWDIDSSEELALYLNEEFLSFIKVSAQSSAFSSVDRFQLPKEMLVQGTNTISLRTRDDVFSGFQNEKWGVKFIDLTDGPFVIMPPIIDLLLIEQSE